MIAEAEFDAFELERHYGFAPTDHRHWLEREPNRRLRDAIQGAIEAEKFIEPEQDRIRALMAKAKKPEEIEAREFQTWYVEKYLTRAADLAEERLNYFNALTTPEHFAAEMEKCRTDKEHWFRYYAWGYDPRARTPLAIVPFALHPRQADLVHELDDVVFNRKTSLLIEKARDEGATELIVRWGLHCWTYAAGFSMLLSSRTEDEVDTKKKQGTLFERARFQIRRLPDWMRPEGFDIDRDLLPDKLIANPNGNALVGQAPVENMGRGDRVTCAMFDEFAFWRFGGYPQFRSMSQTTDSILMPSSVAGKFNQYADLAFDGFTPKFEMDWRDNPFKDRRWYDSLPYGFIGPKMSKTTIAQEVDRNYSASQPGKVWDYDESLTFITRSEFLLPFKAAGLEHKFYDAEGRFRIPDDWRVTRTNDYGKSEGHDWAHLVGAQPRAAYPLSDTHFIFLARNLEPNGLNTEQAVRQWSEWEAGLGLRDRNTLRWIAPKPGNYNSHEQAELRSVLMSRFGEHWVPWDTDYETGIATIEDWWTPVSPEDPNPFRPQLKGRNRLVFVAPDNEYQLAYNDRLQTWFVTSSETEFGFNLARKQIDAYHFAQSELGKPVKAMRPVKEFDDIVDCLVPGTLVNTGRGQIAIESVTTDDLVMTRQGWKPVQKAAKCADGVTVFTLTDAEGRQITGTGNHKIWTVNRGWTALRGITVNDTILAWQDQNESNSTAIHSSATRTHRTQPTATISKGPRSRSMWPSGDTITEMFQRVITSIMPTRTPSTTISPTWSSSPPANMWPSTWPNGHSWIERASIVGPHFEARFDGLASARPYAKIGAPTASIWQTWIRSVFGAASRSLRLATPRAESEQCTARAVAVRSLVKNVERQSVYNLNVADAHEYFANGILVANCVRGYSVNWNRAPGDYTKDEKVEIAITTLSPSLAQTSIDAMPDGYERDGLIQRRALEQSRVVREMNRPVRRYTPSVMRRR